MVKIPFSNTRCRAWHRKSQTFKFVILTDWSTLLFSVRVTQSCKFASFKYKADGLMHAPPKLNSLMLVGDNYQLNSFQPTMGYQGTNVNFLVGLIGVFELFAYFLILKLPPVTCKLKWRLILHVRLWLHISMFQLAGNLSGLPARLRRGRSRGSWQTGSRKQHGRRSGEGVRGDNGVSPPHPIHIRRQKQGKA